MEPLLDRRDYRVQPYLAGQGGEAAEQRGARQRPAQVLLRHPAGRDHQQPAGSHRADVLAQAEILERACRVDQHEAARSQAGEDLHLVQQGRITDDQRVRVGDRLAGPYRLVVDPAEGHHRRAHPFRPEAGERLRVLTLAEGGDRQQLRRRHRPLHAAGSRRAGCWLTYWQPRTPAEGPVVANSLFGTAEWPGSARSPYCPPTRTSGPPSVSSGTTAPTISPWRQASCLATSATSR